jgi:hypothetical protein
MTAGDFLLPPFDRHDDTALLAHFSSARAARCVPVADPEATRPDRIDAILDGVFDLNGETHRLADPIAWLVNPSRDIEWHILLHKFYYAVGLGLAFERTGELRYVQRWVALLSGWMDATPPGYIAADVTGRRVQNWIYSLHYFVGPQARDAGGCIPAPFFRRLLRALHEQTEFLCANLAEKRNHRTLALAAIFLAGVVFPEMTAAARWRAFALEEATTNLAADLLADGVHCELSTDYHHLVLKNALNFRRLAAQNGIAVPAAFDAALQRGLVFSLHVHKPDGIVPSLSDGDAGSFLGLLEQGAALFDRADMLYVATQGRRGSPPAERVAHFPVGGYSTIRSDWGERSAYTDAQYLVFDHGPVGEGNHGHFDCLSFELAAHGRSLIVDPGRYTYSEAGTPNWRVHFRGTAAHNTVCVDGMQQTRYEPAAVPGGTRHAAGSTRHRIAGPAPDARLTERHHDPRIDLLHGHARSHAYDAQHDRCIVFVDRRYWIVSDWLRAPTLHDYRLNFQLGPHAQDYTALARGIDVRVASPGLAVLQPARPGVQVALADGWVSARYGEKQAAPAVQSRARGRATDFDSVLVPWRDAAPTVQVEDVAVAADAAGNEAAPCALRITLGSGRDRVVDHWFHARGQSARRWRIGNVEFTGRWAYWRQDAQGRIGCTLSPGGALLSTPQAESAWV